MRRCGDAGVSGVQRVPPPQRPKPPVADIDPAPRLAGREAWRLVYTHTRAHAHTRWFPDTRTLGLHSHALPSTQTV